MKLWSINRVLTLFGLDKPLVGETLTLKFPKPVGEICFQFDSDPPVVVGTFYDKSNEFKIVLNNNSGFITFADPSTGKKVKLFGRPFPTKETL